MEIPEELKLPLKKALSRAEYGDMTVGEMRRYLTDPRRKNTGFAPEIADRVIDLLKNEGVLDDKRVLKNLVKRLDQKHFGPRRIRQELTRRLFAPAYVEAALARNVDYGARADRFLADMPRAAEIAADPAGRKKLADRLIRAGFDSATSYAAVKRLSRADDDYPVGEAPN